MYEEEALKKFSMERKIILQPSGLYVNPTWPFLATTPDLIIDADHLVEVKCPYSAREEKITPETVDFLVKNESGDIVLKKDHNYSYQIQGQLAISKRKSCFFVVYTFSDFFVQHIEYDESFFLTEMLPKLENFYKSKYRPFLAKQF